MSNCEQPEDGRAKEHRPPLREGASARELISVAMGSHVRYSDAQYAMQA